MKDSHELADEAGLAFCLQWAELILPHDAQLTPAPTDGNNTAAAAAAIGVEAVSGGNSSGLTTSFRDSVRRLASEVVLQSGGSCSARVSASIAAAATTDRDTRKRKFEEK